jgi:DNA-binding response OmpR family regulator
MKILVIDDDHVLRNSVTRVLRSHGYEVVTAADGERGMTMFRNERPELVITDIIMPQKEGIETIRLMRRECPDIKIVAISGGGHFGNFDILAIAHKLGADDVMHKPFDATELLRRVRQLQPLPAAAPGPDGDVAA